MQVHELVLTKGSLSPRIQPGLPERIATTTNSFASVFDPLRWSNSGVSKPFDLLGMLGKFGFERKVSLRDPETIAAFVDKASKDIEGALEDSELVHGQRTEAMFEALLLSLGQFELLKGEDSGRLFPDTRYTAPDFRVVLEGGEHWLIEVKNVYEREPLRQRRRLFSERGLRRLSAYARATGAELKVAVFWARWSIWTLVSPERLMGADGGLTLEMSTAIRVNELSRLGDRTVGTRAPLRVRFTMDQERTSRVSADGTVICTVGEARMYCRDRELMEPNDQEIAWMFMRYGEWKEEGPEAVLDGDRLLAMEYRWKPREPSDQGFDMVGTLSRMFARYYAQKTIDSGEVVQLRAPPQREWLERLVNRKAEDKALPLWQFLLEPNYDEPRNAREVR